LGISLKEEKVEISVVDSGHGIEERHLSRIFDPFFTTKEAGTGTGLGLSLAYNIVKEQGGHIDVSSQLDIGTQFTIRLVKSGLQHA
jgi:signal transduction histidine kinase